MPVGGVSSSSTAPLPEAEVDAVSLCTDVLQTNDRPVPSVLSSRRLRWAAFAVILGASALGGIATFHAGSLLAAPTQRSVGPPPKGLGAENVEFHSPSGALLKGWLVPGESRRAGVVLMHGINGSRLQMLRRARFLANAGYGVLLFDFQANGESLGEHQTFGYLECLDARAAVEFLRSRRPGRNVGAIGMSLGGAAAVLGPHPLEVQALIVEEVYPTLVEATSNRIAHHLGWTGRALTPLLLCQLWPRLGFSARDLRPIDRIGAVTAPIFLIAGGRDVDTPPEESRRLFAAAPNPKQYWEIEGAGHQDFHAFTPEEYESRVLDFFGRNLTDQPAQEETFQ